MALQRLGEGDTRRAPTEPPTTRPDGIWRGRRRRVAVTVHYATALHLAVMLQGLTDSIDTESRTRRQARVPAYFSSFLHCSGRRGSGPFSLQYDSGVVAFLCWQRV